MCVHCCACVYLLAIVVYLIENDSHADIKEQQPKLTSSDSYQRMVEDRDQKIQDLKRKTEELESRLKNYEKQEPTPALKNETLKAKGKYVS